MSELVEWLRARLDEDEAAIGGTPGMVMRLRPSTRRFADLLLADIAAKRAILGAGGPHVGHEDCEVGEHIQFPGWESATCSDNCGPDVWWAVVKHLATAYADRPGYQESWRP